MFNSIGYGESGLRMLSECLTEWYREWVIDFMLCMRYPCHDDACSTWLESGVSFRLGLTVSRTFSPLTIIADYIKKMNINLSYCIEINSIYKRKIINFIFSICQYNFSFFFFFLFLWIISIISSLSFGIDIISIKFSFLHPLCAIKMIVFLSIIPKWNQIFLFFASD